MKAFLEWENGKDSLDPVLKAALLRDIADLTGCGILVQDAAGGRSTSYSLKPNDVMVQTFPRTWQCRRTARPLTP